MSRVMLACCCFCFSIVHPVLCFGAYIHRHLSFDNMQASLTASYDETNWTAPMHIHYSLHTKMSIEYVMSAFFTEYNRPEHWHYVLNINGCFNYFPIAEFQSNFSVETDYLSVVEDVETYSYFDGENYNVSNAVLRMSAGIPFVGNIQYRSYSETTDIGEEQKYEIQYMVSGRFEDKRYGYQFMIPEPQYFTLFTLSVFLFRQRI